MDENDFAGLIIGDFKIKKKIGDGAYSMVFLAEVLNSKTENKSKRRFLLNSKKSYIACKIIPRQKVKEKKLSKRLNQEIRIHQLMHHENVVQMIDVQKDDLFYYIFLEFCSCGTLFDIVVQKGKLNEIESAIFFKQILLGLQYIHSINVAHRDLKPENILIDHFRTIKIADFGLSKILSNDNNGLTKTPCGSPCYASPECISGLPYDARKSDIWSCGVILYTILAGHLPWTCRVQSKLFKQIRSGEYKMPSYLSYSCSDLIRKLMTVDNSQRITIEEALNHPFLKNIRVKNSVFEYKYVSLRKIDLFLGADEEYEYYGIFDHLSIENKQNCDSCCQSSFFDIRKRIETENDKERRREKCDILSSITNSKDDESKLSKKSNHDACQVSVPSSSENDTNAKSQSKGKSEKKMKNKIVKKKEKKNLTNNKDDSNDQEKIDSSIDLNYSKYKQPTKRNIEGCLTLIPRMSEKNSLLYSCY